MPLSHLPQPDERTPLSLARCSRHEPAPKVPPGALVTSLRRQARRGHASWRPLATCPAP